MKKRFFAITLIVIGAFIACKKVGENIADKKYSDVELNIDKNSSFKEEERKIKEGVMDYQQISIGYRKFIVTSLVMENNHPKAIVNGMNVFNKLSLQQQIDILRILLPSSNITIYDNLKKSIVYEYKFISNNNETPILSPKCWETLKNSTQRYGCPESGSDVCFKYNPNC